MHWSVILAIVLGGLALLGVICLAIAFGVSPGASPARLAEHVRGVHLPVRAASTSAIDRSHVRRRFYVDQILLQDGDRVLLKDQPDPTENGIYVVGQPLRRAHDFCRNKQVVQGNSVYVQEGHINRGVTFRLRLDERTVSLGHTELHWSPEIHSMFHPPSGDNYVLASNGAHRKGVHWKHIAGLLNLHEEQKNEIGIADPEDDGGLRFENDFKWTATGLQLPGSQSANGGPGGETQVGVIPVMAPDGGGTLQQRYILLYDQIPV